MTKEQAINEIIKGTDTNLISDGYHTFAELYEHRITLYIALALSISVSNDHSLSSEVWRSQKHSDGNSWEGWFVLGIGKSAGNQITYHLPMDKWPECEFAQTLEKAPTFDNHTSIDVLNRIKKL